MPENTEVQAPVVADQPAVAAEPTTPPPAVPETPAPAPAAPTISVSIPPPAQPAKKPGFRPRNQRPQSQMGDRPTGRSPEEIAAFIARKNAEHMDILEKAGFSPVAVSTIVNNFASKEAGYERGSSRDHLVLMLEAFAQGLRYGIDVFTINESSILDSLLNQALANLLAVEDLMKLDGKEGVNKVRSALDSAWSRKMRIMGDNVDTFMAIKRYLMNAINPTVPDGYAGRARYLLECIIFVRANQVEIFSGMIHAERVPAPGWILRKLGIRDERVCPKCGSKMVFLRWKHRLVCTSVTCENWEDPTPPYRRDQGGEGGDAPERISKSHTDGYDSGKPIATTSGKERFNKRFQKKQFTPEQKAAFEKKKAERAAMAQMARENNEKIAKGQQDQWAALDKLKLGDAPAEPQTEQPAQEAIPDNSQLPPPPAEVPIPEENNSEGQTEEEPASEEHTQESVSEVVPPAGNGEPAAAADVAAPPPEQAS